MLCKFKFTHRINCDQRNNIALRIPLSLRDRVAQINYVNHKWQDEECSRHDQSYFVFQLERREKFSNGWIAIAAL